MQLTYYRSKILEDCRSCKGLTLGVMQISFGFCFTLIFAATEFIK